MDNTILEQIGLTKSEINVYLALLELGSSSTGKIVDKSKVGFPFYWVGDKAIAKYGIDAIPTLLVIKNGRIAERIIGKRSEKYLDKKIGDLLDAQKP